MFEKTCAATQKSKKSHVFWIKKKRKIGTLEHWFVALVLLHLFNKFRLLVVLY